MKSPREGRNEGREGCSLIIIAIPNADEGTTTYVRGFGLMAMKMDVWDWKPGNERT